jgi:hypothetical protein
MTKNEAFPLTALPGLGPRSIGSARRVQPARSR